jgi:hypothetical protein
MGQTFPGKSSVQQNSFYSPQRRKERKGLIILKKVLFYSWPSFLSAVILGGSTAKKK